MKDTEPIIFTSEKQMADEGCHGGDTVGQPDSMSGVGEPAEPFDELSGKPSGKRGRNKGDNLRELAEMSIGKLLWRYSLPAVVGMLVMQLYNVVDRIFIGQIIGPEAIAGLAITFPVTNIATALGVLIGAGASARVSIFLGRDDYPTARRVLGNSLVLTLVIGVCYIGMFAIFIDQVLELFGANEVTLPYARDFMLFLLPGLMLTNLTYSFNNVMRASGFPVKAMITMFIGAAMNIILDPIFIYVFRWGIKGAAIATDISMAVCMVFVMWHFFREKNGPVVFRRGIYSLDRRIIWGIVGIGAAPFIINVASCAINILINRSLLSYGGVEAIAASGIFVTYTAMVCCIMLGICQGMQPIVGFNYGHRSPGRVVRTFWYAVGAASVVSVAGWCGGMVIPDLIARAFVNNDSLVDFTAHALSRGMLCFWVVGFQIVATTYFQSIGKIGLSIFLSLTRQVIFFIPLLLILPRWFGLEGVWSSFFVSDICATLVTVVMIAVSLPRLRAKMG